ncbi:MAG: histidine phosphatase family protein [Eggerthellaceae bacterium]|nr:histidine phosphatase family protein [Eggerthellaceae bacterium]
MELTLIRHGQTPGNGEKRYVGIVDQPLSEAGCEQARAAGVREDVSRVYVSTLQRTHETASIMFPNAEQIVVEGIQEMDFGVFAGRTPDEMTDDPQYRAWVDSMCLEPCPGGESQAELTDRVCAAMESLLRDAADRGEERLVVVAHGGTMMGFLDRFGNDPSKRYWEWLVGNCEGYRINVTCDEAGLQIHSIDRW